jgi:predicted MPP superfamily phosphohydrolase
MALSRRALLTALVNGGVGLGVGGFTYGAAHERHRLERTATELSVSGLDPAHDGLRIAFLTDIHHSQLVPATDVERAVALAQSASPDLIMLGGDYVSFADRSFVGPMAELLRPLHAPHGVFGVIGNHDEERSVATALGRNGVDMLLDSWTRITVRREPLDIAGIRFWTRRGDVIARALRGAGPTVLLLAHDPRRLREAAALNVGGELAGHTHGGQVVLPGIGALAARKFPVASGLVRRDNTAMFVSRGIGTVYAPVRIGCPPEVSIVTLRRRAGF